MNRRFPLVDFCDTRLAARLLALSLCLAAFTGRLVAFETLGFQWPAGEVGFLINPNFPDVAIAGDADRQVEILLCAADAWRDQTRADFTFIFRGITDASPNSDDRFNTVAWVDMDGGDAVASTIIASNGGRLTFDITFFSSTRGVPNTWRGLGEPGPREFDIRGVGVHEFGHALGLDHSMDTSAVMHFIIPAQGLTARTLRADDRAGVESIYAPRPERPAPAVEISSVSPSFGPAEGGNEVLLEGLNFTYTSDSRLEIAGLMLSLESWDVESCGRLRISSMPAHAEGPVAITLANSVGRVTFDGAYRYGAAPPRLVAVVPAEGPVSGGLELAIEGENFTSAARAFIGDQELLAQQLVDAGMIVGKLPATTRGGAVDVRVVQGIDELVLPGGFRYNPYLLRVADAFGLPGQQAAGVEVRVSSPDPLSSVSFGVSYPPALVRIREISAEGTPAELADFAAANIDNEEGVATYGVVMSFNSVEPSFPAGDDETLARLLVDVSQEAEPGASAIFRLASGLGSPPIELIFTRAGDPTELRPHPTDGRFAIVEGFAFIRGNANGDSTVDLADPVFILNHLFLGGADPRPCLDAADANDDGGVDVTDAIFVLNFLFLGGDRPQAPFPFPGADPTADGNDC